MENKSTIFNGEYQLGEYTIAYTCDNARLLEIKVEGKKGIMFVSGERIAIHSSFLVNEQDNSLEIKEASRQEYKLTGKRLEVIIKEEWLGDEKVKTKEYTFLGKYQLGDYLIKYEEDNWEVVEFVQDEKPGVMFIMDTEVYGKFLWDNEKATLHMPILNTKHFNIKEKEIEIAFGWYYDE